MMDTSLWLAVDDNGGILEPNLFFFSWASFAMTLILFVSYVKQAELPTMALIPNIEYWIGIAVSSLVAMLSSLQIFVGGVTIEEHQFRCQAAESDPDIVNMEGFRVLQSPSTSHQPIQGVSSRGKNIGDEPFPSLAAHSYAKNPETPTKALLRKKIRQLQDQVRYRDRKIGKLSDLTKTLQQKKMLSEDICQRSFCL